MLPSVFRRASSCALNRVAVGSASSSRVFGTATAARFFSESSSSNFGPRPFKHDPTGPHPEWKIGEKAVSPFGENPTMVTLNPKEMKVAEVYRFLISSIVPRPIAFVSTKSKDGKGNVAPISFFNGVCSNPAALVISVTVKPDGVLMVFVGKKDTQINIEETGEFVVNIVSEWMIEHVNQASASYPYGTNEAEVTGLTTIPSNIVTAPRIKESAVQFECKVYDKMQIGSGIGSSCLIVGEIVQIHAAEGVFKPEAKGRTPTVSIESLQPISRLGDTWYGRTNDTFEIPRPKV